MTFKIGDNAGANNFNYRKPSNYDWLKTVASNSPIRVKDICDIFGFTSSALNLRLAKGHFPKNDFKRLVRTNTNFGNKTTSTKGFPLTTRLWKKETVLTEILRIEALLAEGN